MKRTIASLLATAVFCASTLVLTAAGGAAQYESWGNDNVGNCAFVAIANLVRMYWPTAPITSDAVVRDWRMYNTTIGALPFLFEDGIGGHKIESFAPVTTRARFIKAANSGGVFALILGGTPAVAVVGASSNGVTFVSWGTELWVSWSHWNGLDPVTSNSATWAPVADSMSSVIFFPDCGNLSPVTQSEPTGSTELLDAPVIQDGGVEPL